jgi:hypothetical protein
MLGKTGPSFNKYVYLHLKLKMPKLSGLRKSVSNFTRKVNRSFGGKSGDRKSLLKKTSSKSFSDITKISNKSKNPFNNLANNKSKSSRVQNYIPSGPSVKPPSRLQRTLNKFKNNNKPTAKDVINGRHNLKKTPTPSKPMSGPAMDLMNEDNGEQLKRRGQMMREARNNAAYSKFRGNLDKAGASQTSRFQDLKKNLGKRGRAQMDTLRRGSGGGVDPSMMYMLMQSKQDAEQAEAERRQAAKDAADNKAVETRQNFFG